MKKKYVLKKWVKDTIKWIKIILGILAFILVFHLAFGITPKDEEAFDRCLETGQSIEACKKNVLGVY